jgi:predicted dehydrogenase
MGTPIRFGIVGVGWMGAFHAKTIAANDAALLVAIADENEDQASCVAAEITGIQASAAPGRHEGDGAPKIYADYRALLDSDIDAVIVASPNAVHAEMSIAAARSGKHIYCEKPMAITEEDCVAVRDAVRTAGVEYTIGYHRRFNPLYQHVKKLMEEGSLGTIFLGESEYNHHIPGDLPLWEWLGKEAIAGSIFHAGSGHNVDLLRYLLGDVVEVSCFTGTFLPRSAPIETEDTAVAMYRFESGAIGKVQCCVGPILPFDFGFRLFGTAGTVKNNHVWLRSVAGFDSPGNAGEVLPEKWIPDNVQGGVSETWGPCLDRFVEVIGGSGTNINDVESALRTSQAVFAALRAAKTGSVVRL